MGLFAAGFSNYCAVHDSPVVNIVKHRIITLVILHHVGEGMERLLAEID